MQHDDLPTAAELARWHQQPRQVGECNPSGQHQVDGEHTHLLRATGNDRGDAPSDWGERQQGQTG